MLSWTSTNIAVSRFPGYCDALNSISPNSTRIFSNSIILNNRTNGSAILFICDVSLKSKVLTLDFKRKPYLRAFSGCEYEHEGVQGNVIDVNREEEQIISSLDSGGSNIPNDAKSDDYVREIELLLTSEEKAILHQNEAPTVAKISTEKWSLLHSLLLSSQFDYVNHLFPSGINLELVDKDGLTVLHKAIIHRRLAVMHLLKRGANPHVKDLDGATPLHYAVQIGCLNTVKLLIQYKADLNAGDDDGWTPLHIAVQIQNIDIVRVLLFKGADRTRRNKNGRTAFDLCLAFGKNFRTFRLANLLKFVATRPTIRGW